MEVWIAGSKSVVGFTAIKELLKRVQYAPASEDELLGLSTILPDDERILEARRRASLTESAKVFERIRFFKTNRVVRHFIKTGFGLVRHVGPLQINVSLAEHLDAGSRLFLETISTRIPEVGVCLHLGRRSGPVDPGYIPSPREARIEQLVSQPGRLSPETRSFLVGQVKLYLNCGDAWTADGILTKLRSDLLDGEIAFLSGLTYSLQMRTIESEFYYGKLSAAERPMDVAWTCSALAVFYVRDHPGHLHSVDRALKLLETGHQLLETATDADWDRAFNRNTCAYLMTRQGDTEGAIRFLHRCMADLGEHPGTDEPARLNKFLILRSLFLYNLSQCHRRLGQIPEALAACAEVLAIDPDYPEYHIELALCHIAAKAHHKALTALEGARALDATIPEIYSEMGVCWRELGDPTKSLECHRQARLLEPDRPDMAYDYAYALSELNRYEECLEVIRDIDLGKTSIVEFEDILSIRAESLVNLNRTPEAVTVLREGIELLPSSEKLRQNMEQVTAIHASMSR